MSDEAVGRLYELVEAADVEAVSDILKTKFSQESLTSAMDVATAQLERDDHVGRRFQICSEMLSAGAHTSFNSEFKYDPDHYNLIQHCCKHGNTDVLKQALDKLTPRSILKRDFLWSCMNSNSVTRAPIHPRCSQFSSPHSPWSIAVRASNIDCMQFLFEYCGENGTILNISPALEYAAETGDLACLSLLIELCPDKHLCTNNVIRTLRNKHYECAKLLINHCTSIRVVLCQTDKDEEWDFILTNMTKNDSAKAVARYVAAERKFECLKYILQDRFVYAVDVNNTPFEHYIPGDRKSVLFHLIRAHQFDLIEHLLKYNVDLNRLCGDTETPFEMAIRKYYDHKTSKTWNVIRALVSHGCDTSNYVTSWERFRLEVLELVLLTGACVVPPGRLRRPLLYPIQSIKIVIENNKIVHPMKHHARLSIRRALTTSRFGTVPKLNGVLPPTLINYLMLPEIDDIEAKYGVHG